MHQATRPSPARWLPWVVQPESPLLHTLNHFCVTHVRFSLCIPPLPSVSSCCTQNRIHHSCSQHGFPASDRDAECSAHDSSSGLNSRASPGLENAGQAGVCWWRCRLISGSRNESHHTLLAWSPEIQGTHTALHGTPQPRLLPGPGFYTQSVPDSVTPTKTRHPQHPDAFTANRTFKRRSKTPEQLQRTVPLIICTQNNANAQRAQPWSSSWNLFRIGFVI